MIGGCGNKEKTATVEFHPMEERIPYWDHPVQTHRIKKNLSDNEKELEFLSEKTLLSRSLISKQLEFSSFQQMELPYMSDKILFESLDENRIVLLDLDQQFLYEYRLDTNNWNEIAAVGPGPGELSFAKDFTAYNDTLYIVSEDARVTMFDCRNNPCEYSHTVRLKQNVISESIQPFENGFIILGNNPTDAWGEELITEIDPHSLFEFDREGNLVHAWGKIYDTKGHWMLLPWLGIGKVRSAAKSNRKIQYFAPFPLLYHYSAEKELTKVTYLTEFDLVKNRYEPQQGLFSSQRGGDFSQISDLVFVDSDTNFFILTVWHRRDMQTSEGSYSRSKDFYLVNSDKDRSFFLGSLKNIQEADIQFTNQHIIFQEKMDKYQIATYNIKQ